MKRNNGTIVEVETVEERKMSFWDKLFGCLLPNEPSPVTFNVDVPRKFFCIFLLEVLEPTTRKSSGSAHKRRDLNTIVERLYKVLASSDDSEWVTHELNRVKREIFPELNLTINKNDGKVFKVTFAVRNNENVLAAVNRDVDRFNELASTEK